MAVGTDPIEEVPRMAAIATDSFELKFMLHPFVRKRKADPLWLYPYMRLLPLRNGCAALSLYGHLMFGIRISIA
jgi:hypothetical protein